MKRVLKGQPIGMPLWWVSMVIIGALVNLVVGIYGLLT